MTNHLTDLSADYVSIQSKKIYRRRFALASEFSSLAHGKSALRRACPQACRRTGVAFQQLITFRERAEIGRLIVNFQQPMSQFRARRQ